MRWWRNLVAWLEGRLPSPEQDATAEMEAIQQHYGECRRPRQELSQADKDWIEQRRRLITPWWL